MADKKISALTAATTPLTGSEVLPIVQSGSTVKVSVDNLTAGKNVTTAKVGAGGVPTTVFDAFAGTGADLNLRFSPAGWNTKHRLGVQFTGNGSVWSNNALMTSAVDGDLDDVSNSGSALVQNTSGNLFFVTAAAGANPRTFTKRFDVDASGDFTVNTGNLVLGTTGKGITTGSAIPLGLGVNGTVTAMTIDTSSNVGIGTTTPGSALTVVRGVGVGAEIAIQANGYSSADQLLLSQDSGGGAYLYNRANQFMTFGTNNAERMRIESGGNIGIGTTSPAAAALLDVQSTTKGVRFPNMTTGQKAAITPSAGTVVFDTTLSKLCVYSGAAWETITSL
jgi:hypothetical protein